jgi:MutS domain V
VPMTVAPVPDRVSEYQRRLEDRLARLKRLTTIDNRISTARGLIFLGAVVAAVIWYSSEGGSLRPVIGFLVLFVALILAHDAVEERLKQARLAKAYWERGLRRLADRWKGDGASGDRYVDELHLYASDLDLFGRGSLFELLCQARTRLGEDTLAEWLRRPVAPEIIRRRQEAVAELSPKVDLRERLAVLDAEVRDDLDQNRLTTWAAEPAVPISGAVRLASAVLAALSLAALAILISWNFLAPFVFMLIVQGLVAIFHGRHIRRLAQTADEAASGLAILSQVLAILEQEHFDSPLLTDVRSRLETQGLPPSRQIARSQRLIGYLNNSLRNQFFAPIALVLGLPVHLVHAIEVWRRDVGPHIPEWLRAVGEFEALACLAGFSHERPDQPFPEILDAGTRFEAAGIGHPLIPRAQCVSNDVRLDDRTRLILISGSNMSGKSTMLRTIGTNLVLAQAGTSVRAQRLSTSVFQIGTAMRIHDSLQSGESLFYAAVSRLKAVVGLETDGRPLLFLFDEILQGTNSHDRLIGSEGVLRALVNRGAVGLVTTHDLALTEMVDRLDSKAVNFHFEDSLVDGKMTFDYRIRPGVVRKSNALEIMRLMGLDV